VQLPDVKRTKGDDQMIVVSACLAGFNCRYDGGNKEDEKIVQLVREGRAIPVCPEQLGGLTTPRTSVEGPIDGSVLSEAGEDFTDVFRKGAEETLMICQKYHCKKAILKAYSPSCGYSEIYDGSFRDVLIPGAGVTAKLLMEHGIEVISERDL